MPEIVTQVETDESKGGVTGESTQSALCLTIQCHPDLERVGERVCFSAEVREGRFGLSRLGPVFVRSDGRGGTPLADPYISRRPLWLTRTAGGGLLLTPEDHASSVAIDGEPLRAVRELTPDELVRGVVVELGRRVVLLLHFGLSAVGRGSDDLGMVGESPAMQQLREQVRSLARVDVPVLIRGETGTGKELVAQAIHGLSARAERPFVCVNMGAVPASTAVSELFGHERGAFTGAVDMHQGYFEQAHLGTLLLDEVGATPREVQAMLLRVLEDGTIRPVGSRAARQVGVRVLAATDEDLELAVAGDRFRAPLYHRLAGGTLFVPPLRERREDIGRLVVHFLRRELAAMGAASRLEPSPAGRPPWLSGAAVASLLRYDWPGNVRQLRNVIRQLVLAHGHAESARWDPTLLARTAGMADPSGECGSVGRVADAAFLQGSPRRRPTRPLPDEAELLRLLEQNRWSVADTAAELGLSRNTVYGLIERCPRLRKTTDLSREEVEMALGSAGGNVERAAEILRVSARALRLRLRALGLR